MNSPLVDEGSGLPRILVVEDDPALRHFVAGALDGLGIDLQLVSCVADAVAALSGAPAARLLLTDLNLRQESGLSLIERLAHEPALHGKAARVAVFSANLDEQRQQRLAELCVWRVLRKPVSMASLRTCVQDALAASPASTVSGPPAPPPPQHATPALGVADEARATAQYFAGDAGLYAAFKASCMSQFRLDVRLGDTACECADGAALMHLAHSLKTVAEMLGHDQISAMATEVESAAATGDIAAAQLGWKRLRGPLLVLSGG